MKSDGAERVIISFVELHTFLWRDFHFPLDSCRQADFLATPTLIWSCERKWLYGYAEVKIRLGATSGMSWSDCNEKVRGR